MQKSNSGVVGPDMAAQTVVTGATQLGYQGPAEASIVSAYTCLLAEILSNILLQWNLDIACGGLTATWTNDDLCKHCLALTSCLSSKNLTVLQHKLQQSCS